MLIEPPSEPPTSRIPPAAHAIILVLLLAAALVRFWRSPYDAGGRLVVPDGAEYAVAAHRLATLGTLDIDVGGERFPSRYPPLFSLLLWPVYSVAPDEIGNGILVVLAFALLMTGAAYAAGWSLAGAWGGVAAPIVVMHHPLLADLARTIMSDLPTAALGVAGMAVFLWMRDRAGAGPWVVAGVIVALAAGLRPLAGALVLPFLTMAVLERRRMVIRLTALLVPPLVLGMLTALYNQSRFGAWSRTGYHYWCPIPYEFPGLTWSTRYFWSNLSGFESPGLWLAALAGAVGIVGLFWRKNPGAGRVAVFVGLAALPISVAHLYYFHLEPRFHVLLIALCCLAGGAGLVVLVPETARAKPWGAVVLASVGLALTLAWPSEDGGSSREAERHLAAYVPPGGTIVTLTDPVPLDPTVLRPGNRRWVPLWRRQNYAGHAIAPRPIDVPRDAVIWPGSHRQPALFAAGATDAVPWTALERPDLLEKRIRLWPGVYLDGTVPVGSEPYKAIAKRFALRPVDPGGWVLQLSIREGEAP